MLNKGNCRSQYISRISPKCKIPNGDVIFRQNYDKKYFIKPNEIKPLSARVKQDQGMCYMINCITRTYKHYGENRPIDIDCCQFLLKMHIYVRVFHGIYICTP